MWYVEALFKTCNAGDWTFYDAINLDKLVKTSNCGWLSKKLHIRPEGSALGVRGVQISLLFRRTRVRRNDSGICNNEEDGEFLRHHQKRHVLESSS
jgi:hypothetical protein